jgi:hypothetical protein
MDITKLFSSLLALILAIVMTFSGGKNTEVTNSENPTQISSENSSATESISGSDSSESSELIISSSEISSSSESNNSSEDSSSSEQSSSSSSEITEETADLVLFAGQSVAAVTVTSSDPSVVKIENGIMKAMKPGVTIITIKSGSEIIREFSVCVSRKIIYGDDREKLYGSSSSKSSSGAVVKIDPFKR